mgnify:CR=1 FL=1
MFDPIDNPLFEIESLGIGEHLKSTLSISSKTEDAIYNCISKDVKINATIKAITGSINNSYV